MELMSKIAMLMAAGGLLTTILGIVLQLFAMMLEEIW